MKPQNILKYLVRCLFLSILFVSLLSLPGTVMGAGEKLRMAFLPNMSQSEILKNFTPFIRALEKETGMAVEVVVGKDYSAVINMLCSNRIDIGMLGAFPLVEAQDECGVKVFVRNLEAAKKNDPPKEAYHSIIITRKDSGISSLKEIRDRGFAFTDPKSTSGFLLPMLALKKSGLSLDNLGKVSYVKKHENSLLAVFERQVEAGALSEDIYLRGENVNVEEIKVLWKSEPVYHGPWVASKAVTPEKLEVIKAAFLKISGSGSAKSIFEKSYIKGFVPATDKDYAIARKLLKLKDSL